MATDCWSTVDMTPIFEETSWISEDSRNDQQMFGWLILVWPAMRLPDLQKNNSRQILKLYGAIWSSFVTTAQIFAKGFHLHINPAIVIFRLFPYYEIHYRCPCSTPLYECDRGVLAYRISLTARPYHSADRTGLLWPSSISHAAR